VLHAEGAEGLARGQAGDGIGHVQPDPLLADHDRPYIDLCGVFDQVIDGVSAKDIDTFALHDLRDRVSDLHPRSSPSHLLQGAGMAGRSSLRQVA
jgi:hypothetical protein